MSSPKIIVASLAARAAEWYLVTAARAAMKLARQTARWRLDSVDAAVGDVQRLERDAELLVKAACSSSRTLRSELPKAVRGASRSADWTFDDDEPDGVPWWKGPES